MSAPSTMSAPSDKPQNRLIIALDFGTTFSGVAYAFDIVGKKADVVCIREWPGLRGEKQAKVPTLIMYEEKQPSADNEMDFSQVVKWGGQVHWHDPAVRGVKLLLDPDQDRPAYLPHVSFNESRKGFPSRPCDVASDFFRAIYKHADEVIRGTTTPAFYKSCQKDFVLSVPAVWSDKAKDLTLKAAKAAGIHPITLIKEPEAAALYTLTTEDHTMAKHSAFLVCDAGGGTVDLTVYEVEEMEPRLKLSEVIPGQGGIFGSLGLNERFEQKVRELVGEDQFARLKEPDNRGDDAWSRALDEFDRCIKKDFCGDPESLYSVSFRKANLQPHEAMGLYSNCWDFTGEVLQDIYEPLIQDILQLLDNQIQRALAVRGEKIQSIFLVGGFGSSHYLKKRCLEVYEQQGIAVVQPDDAWGAIAHGAVLSRLPDRATVVSTRAVRHYGTWLWTELRTEEDRVQPLKRRKYFPANGHYKVQQNRWFVRMGDILVRDRAIRIACHLNLRGDAITDDFTLTDYLYVSEAPQAPLYPGPNVRLCCTLKSRLRGVKKRDLPRIRGDDRRTYYQLRFNLVLCTSSVNLQFFLEFPDRELGSKVTGKVEAAYA